MFGKLKLKFEMFLEMDDPPKRGRGRPAPLLANPDGSSSGIINTVSMGDVTNIFKT